eukprot:Protomagalhaensia_sp_Gyna_25__4761@NODE_472_length_3341_cov_88_813749_g164_i1_p2_GENE_NODE_472_length_3341_cov_88_813749_g164_i1NODE_472_length_3341_cov_88_813749_g164_i1_p2_ORF_typecomplete_len291_score33_31Mqo/PF06039_15/5_3e57DAO/PF01266_24/7_5e13GMC_oxred_N/PF00732_19/0_00011Lycopene_cycl/PF05834_12/0_00077FAD_binding_3/PF01494_19/0_00085Thi4/PF01946_17/0_0014NAD_binding_8/PF13450_6/0_0028Pyr_redox_2/PF07992_14/0_0025Pyr_redox/PF00070_27/0_0069FAD_oxidored/PF12831_7/0_014K_oxygenase/PF13434_
MSGPVIRATQRYWLRGGYFGGSGRAIATGRLCSPAQLPGFWVPRSQHSGLAKRYAMLRPNQMSREAFDSGLPETADVVIIGGGVTGSALLYQLAEFTDLKRVLLLERREGLAKVTSGPNNNSQTIHCGDIETNYTPQKAATVQRLANMLRNFATKLPPHERDKTIARMQKMAIGVGNDECAFMEKRFNDFSPYFKNLKLLNKEQISKLEPAVAYQNVDSRIMRPENVVANFVADEHCAVDYFHLTRNLVNVAQQDRGNRDVRFQMRDCQRSHMSGYSDLIHLTGSSSHWL